MKVRLKDIGPEGLRVAQAFDRAFFQAALAGIESFLDEATGGIDVMVTRTGARVFVHGTVRARLAVPCGRCLEPAEVRVEGPATATYLPAPLATAAQQELADDQLDVATYRGEELDLFDLARDQVLLGIPMVARCRQDCRGLCVRCGANLNLGSCGCPPLEDSDGSLGARRRPE